MDDVTIEHRPDVYRFVISVDGVDAGFAEYRTGPGVRAFVHTVTEDAFEGRGLAARVVERALEDTRAEGLLVEPYCPYVRSFVKKDERFHDLVPPDRRAAFGLPDAART